MRTPALLIAAACLLAGCTEPPAGDVDGADRAEAGAAQAGVEPEDPAIQVGPDFELDQPIPEADIRTSLALAAPPTYQPDTDMLLLRVEVDNQGASPLVGQGEMPVQLAAILAGPEGVDTPPGRRDFIRARLPLIRAGSTGEVGVRVPAEDILGLGLQFELVQERAGWFGRRYGQPVLEVGTFTRCDGAAATLCDASGTPIATAGPATQDAAPAGEPAQ